LQQLLLRPSAGVQQLPLHLPAERVSSAALQYSLRLPALLLPLLPARRTAFALHSSIVSSLMSVHNVCYLMGWCYVAIVCYEQSIASAYLCAAFEELLIKVSSSVRELCTRCTKLSI
jgi:hypothetical protein